MNLSVRVILLAVAMILFALCAGGVASPSPKLHLGWLGAAFLAAAFLFG